MEATRQIKRIFVRFTIDTDQIVEWCEIRCPNLKAARELAKNINRGAGGRELYSAKVVKIYGKHSFTPKSGVRARCGCGDSFCHDCAGG